MNEELTSAVVQSMEILIKSETKAHAVLWWLAANNPKAFIEAVGAKGYYKSTGFPVVSTTKSRVLELAAQQDTPFNTNGKISLIKAYRQITGEGLLESKDWVEANFNFSDS